MCIIYKRTSNTLNFHVKLHQKQLFLYDIKKKYIIYVYKNVRYFVRKIMDSRENDIDMNHESGYIYISFVTVVFLYIFIIYNLFLLHFFFLFLRVTFPVYQRRFITHFSQLCMYIGIRCDYKHAYYIYIRAYDVYI